MTIYEIFAACFEKLDISEEIFNKLANIENAKCFVYRQDGEPVGFALVEQCALRLLCVLPAFQGRGIGTALLGEAEDYVRSQGYQELLTGGASSNLLIGAPQGAVGFFEKHGFAIVGGCEEMERTIQDFVAQEYPLEVPQQTSFGWYQGSVEELQRAVADVDETWVQYFTDLKKVFCGWSGDEIASFCIIDYDAECILSNGHNKVGMIGCVGTVHRFRRQGIGLKMVALASEELKKEHCDKCFIHYTGVAGWYAKLGYQTFLKESFARKTF